MGGSFVSRTEAAERVWGRIHRECGYAVDTQVHEPAWNRWRWSCSGAACEGRGVAWQHPTGPCGLCGAALQANLEEAVLDLEVRSAEVPKLYMDVTVRHAVGNDEARVRRAARADGTTNAEAEGDKADRYPPDHCPYKAGPLAMETYGRHGRVALHKKRTVWAGTLDFGGAVWGRFG